MADKENLETHDIDDNNDNTNWDAYIANRDKESQDDTNDTNNEDESMDLSDVLDESDSDSGEFETDLAQFVDEDSASADKTGGTSQYEESGASEQNEQSEELRNINEEEKQKKIRNIKKIAAVGSATVVFVAVLLTVWTLVQARALSYVLTYTTEIDGVTQTHRISTNDFKLLILYNEDSWHPMEDAMDFLVNILTIEQAASVRNLSLTADELQHVREVAQQDKDFINAQIPQLNRVSIEFIERVHSFSYLAHRIIEVILDDVGFVLDEEEFSRELADYMVFMQLDYIEARLRYVITTSAELANEAKSVLEEGEMTFEEILMEFFYDSQIAEIEDIETMDELLEAYGFETLDEFIEQFHATELWELGNLPAHVLGIEDINHLVSLEVGEVSNVLRFEEGMYVVFILDHIEMPPDDMIEMIHAEIEEMFTQMYLDDHRWEAFQSEFQRWQEEFEAGMTINHRALENLDLAAILDW